MLSELGQIGLALVAAGLLGGACMPLFLQACKWADWELIPVHCRRRVLRWQRTAPAIIACSAGLVAAGLLISAVAGAAPG
jgi:hypothetical protein